MTIKNDNPLMKIFVLATILFSVLSACNKIQENTIIPKSYNVIWDSPSQDALESMPLSGRKGAGANVWVQDGSIWLYLAHNGAYDEQARLMKLGCVRITPKDMKLGGTSFRQELDLASGAIQIQQGDFKASLWFAGETLVFESTCAKPQVLDVDFGSWRDKHRDSLKLDMFHLHSINSDNITANKDGFSWFHRNTDFGVNVLDLAKQQGIPAEAVHDVTTRRLFGGAIAVKNGISEPVESDVEWQFWKGKAWTGQTVESTKQTIVMRLGAGLDADPSGWQAEAKEMLSSKSLENARAEELKRWNEFWSRSNVVINPAAGKEDSGWLIGQNYQLFRYMLACNRDGELPLLFNGGIFTVDNFPGRINGNNNDELPISQGGPSTPDFRRWLYCSFMSQNQRWLGWPTLANGDADLFSPSLSFYRDRSATAAARAKTNGAEGVVYPEPLDAWGLCTQGVAPLPNGLCGAEHLTYHFSMMLEHAWMALQAHDQLGVSISKDLQWIEGTVKFYDSFYRAQTQKRLGKELGEDGKLVIYPACGLEFAGGATNPIEVVCGLKRITAGLLAQPDLSSESRSNLERIQNTLPDLPTAMREGRLSLQPAKLWERSYNKWEPIEMYAFWPYRMVGVTKPETMQLARDTWQTVPADRARLCKQDYSWMANVVNMAALAWPDSAKARAIYKMANIKAPQARFPAFFGPGHDWLPDHNWGGSGMTGIQEMLMAADPYGDGKIYLLPAWPKEWNVDFKLHASQQTTVEASISKGKVVKLLVNPESRRKDIVLDSSFIE
ncbi:MAG: DUF5703 domain-containing protein [Mariniphaga sp.]